VEAALRAFDVQYLAAIRPTADYHQPVANQFPG
jgi:hypothetical protein